MEKNKHEILLEFLNRINRVAQSGINAGIQGCCPGCLYRFDPLLNRIEAGAYLTFEPGTLAVWDCTKRNNLQPIKFDNAVRYRLSSLNRFADARVNPE